MSIDLCSLPSSLSACSTSGSIASFHCLTAWLVSMATSRSDPGKWQTDEATPAVLRLVERSSRTKFVIAPSPVSATGMSL